MIARASSLPQHVAQAFERISPDGALDAIFAFVGEANRYAEETAPWQLAKRRDDPALDDRLRTALYHLAEAARLACWYLWPFIPRAAGEGHTRLAGHAPQPQEGVFGALRPGSAVTSGSPLFPRLDSATSGTELAPAPRRSAAPVPSTTT